MRNRTRFSRLALASALCFAIANAAASAYAPSVADLDATARAVGNRRDIAERIGESIFRTRWPAEVNQVSANELGRHLIVGIRMWGVKFHRPMTRELFVDEVVSLAQLTFAAAPAAEEIDFWASVPIDVNKDVVVTGDLAKPTSRTVFSVTVLRDEPETALRDRTIHWGAGVFWDEQWSHDAFEPGA